MIRSGTKHEIESKPARRERAVSAIVLAGGLDASPLERASGRSVLDLNIAPGRTVLGAWERAFEGAGVRTIGIAVGGPSPEPVRLGGGVRVLRDPEAYRGPAGAARDAWDRLGRASTVVIVEASRWSSGGVVDVLEAHAISDADVTVGVNPDRTPAGVYAVSGSAFEHVARVGYVDLKEQWLPALRSRGMDVRGHLISGESTLPVRTLPQLLEVARANAPEADTPAYRVICRGARVEREQDVIDSVVMPGAVVEAGAVVARSIVLPGARVGSGDVIVDGVARMDGAVAGQEESCRSVHEMPLRSVATSLSPAGARAHGAGRSTRIAA